MTLDVGGGVEGSPEDYLYISEHEQLAEEGDVLEQLRVVRGRRHRIIIGLQFIRIINNEVEGLQEHRVAQGYTALVVCPLQLVVVIQALLRPVDDVESLWLRRGSLRNETCQVISDPFFRLPHQAFLFGRQGLTFEDGVGGGFR
eukprot:CAMPEP_0170480324 /NCGR_PEP_ID=MMETSP0208-20121228/1210_1 /TAXON_ID=197538 /ORGANISM="Strombidium inclinatum, Strain S3" /LENGTH=143 /DNA_ID=CAMNT_0010752855 /DNA_START=1618 /DNA_END=2049 /DNA_ORIENTATION=+